MAAPHDKFDFDRAEALILAERQFPLGLQRLASLPWPDADVPTATSTERALLEHLALENERLSRLGHQLDGRLELADRRLASERLAVQMGRATATLVPVAILAAASAFIVVEIGWHALSGLMANVAVLFSISLTLLAGVFTLLDRLGLLAAPARAVRGWLEKQAAPVLKSVSDLKRD